MNVLRDTGCSGVVVMMWAMITKEQYTGDFSFMLLTENTNRKDQIARITVDTLYLSDEVEAQCLPDAKKNLIT